MFNSFKTLTPLIWTSHIRALFSLCHIKLPVEQYENLCDKSERDFLLYREKTQKQFIVSRKCLLFDCPFSFAVDT